VASEARRSWGPPPPVERAPPPVGAGLAIVVNANAKRGGRRVAAEIARVLPGANLRLTRSEEELLAWLKILKNPRCLLSAGGDGTIIGLLNALARVTEPGTAFPPMGLLPLGTGNAWANAVGTPKLDRCVRILEREGGALPFRRFGLVEVKTDGGQGTLAHFAGSGFDAMILDDYKRQLEESIGVGKTVSKSVWGYLSATLLRTVPKIALFGNPHVLVENLGDEAYTMTADGKLLKIHGAGRGTVLYDGPGGCISAGTTPEFGYGFRAFPFAERLPGTINLRVYDRSALGAVAAIPRLWRGTHPLEGMHDWFTTAARVTFSRPMALQVGGDARGVHQTVEYHLAPWEVRMLDWRRLL
jgi:Diacylglycerol kinase catalytic domain